MPAEDMMQAFAYRHLVPVSEWVVSVSGRPARRSAGRVLSALPVKIPAGGTCRIQVEAPTTTLLGTLQFELDQPPEGVSITEVQPAGMTTYIVLKHDAAKAKPGLKGNLILSVFLKPAPAGAAASQPAVNVQRVLVGALPAIPFEIVAAPPPSTGRKATK